MPFTFSHPAAVLPLGLLPKKRISLTGLVVGSVTPDFEYFLRLQIDSEYSHTIAGMFWFDLPLGIGLAFLFHLFVRDELIGGLPGWFRRRLTAFTQFNWTQHFRMRWFVVLLSLLTGIFSHLCWDAFTHESGWFVHRVALLRHSFHLAGYTVPLYDFLQHGSTLAGAAIILYSIRRLPEDPEVKGNFSWRYWIIASCVMLLVIAGGALAGKDYFVYGELIITGLSGGMLGMLFAGQIRKLRFRN